jgi:methylated-DNA-[protein]-cysteine S-methyltransferase
MVQTNVVKESLLANETTQYTDRYHSPLGVITIASNGEALTGLWFDGQKYFGDTLSAENKEQDLPVFKKTRQWLDIYFRGENPDFTPPLSLHASPFRLAVWEILQSISYGHVMTYGDIANAIAKQMRLKKMSAQAVGGAVGHNPVSIIIPCHRVVGSNGSLTGYAGGIDKKVKLLALEKTDTRHLFVPKNGTAL